LQTGPRCLHQREIKEGRVFQTYEPPSRRAARGSLLALIGFVGMSLLVWAANGAITAGSVRGWYGSLAAPPGTPPTWLFAPVWTTLYPVMGVAAWLVWRRIDVGAERKRAALRTWGWQLLVNSLWSPAFFGLHSLGLGFVVICTLLATVLLTIRRFVPLQPLAAALMAPYAVWIGYAAYLNAGFWWLNHG
jgi:tryptophan-rich sensory protein